MDKFGIFNLLTKFLDFYQTNKGTFSNLNNGSNPSDNINDGGSSPANLFNGLSSLFAKNENTSPKNNSKATSPLPRTPLQASMLNTIYSHDEFVKRVNKNKPN